MASRINIRPFEADIFNDIVQALMDLSKPNNNPSYVNGIRESKAEKGKKGFGKTSRSTALPKHDAKNKRKRDKSYANENSSAKRGQTDADFHPAQPKFNKIEFINGKLIFRRVGQCSASKERTPFKPNLGSNIPD